MDVVLFSRIQFALTIMFHYLFPPLAIGLGIFLVYLEGMHLRTGDPIYHTAARFWTRIFGLNFALGVFSPTIHSLRLHYVEFFRKFYEGGGRPFEPFRSQLVQRQT